MVSSIITHSLPCKDVAFLYYRFSIFQYSTNGTKSGILNTKILSKGLWILCRKPFPSPQRTLCPRRCGADRAAGRTGFCGAGATLKSCPRCPAPLGGALHQRHKGQRHGVLSGCTLKSLLLPELPHQCRGAGERDHRGALGRDLFEFTGAGRAQHQSGHPGQWQPWIIAALDIARTKGPRSAHRVQHRRLRDRGKRRGLARVHRHLAG